MGVGPASSLRALRILCAPCGKKAFNRCAGQEIRKEHRAVLPMRAKKINFMTRRATAKPASISQRRYLLRMAVPVSQMWTVASYVIRHKLAGRKQYALVLMLEPLFRCNLACAGCGKIQYPAHILKRQLTPEECFKAVDECGAPVVSIPGGEPLMHPEIDKIVEGLVGRKKYIYLCTNALLLKEKIHLFKPSKYLSFSVHVDGQREEHDLAVCREGGYDIAVDAVQEALRRGFRVTTNT